MADASPAESTHRRVPAVTRAVAILRRLGAAPEPIGVNQLARELDLVPSTCLHILRVLTDEGLVAVDPASKRYSIDVGILPIARRAIQRNGFASLAQPALADLSREYGVTAIATQLAAPDQMVVLALAHPAAPLRLHAELGSRFPALISATGRCVAAFNDLDPATLRDGFARLRWDHPPSFEAWQAEVAQTRRDGYGVDRGAYISGVTIIAAPLFNAAGAADRSLVAIGLSDAMEAAGVPAIATEMLRRRDEIAGCFVTDTGTGGS